MSRASGEPTPAWMKSPSCAGRWIIEPYDGMPPYSRVCIELSEIDIERGAPFRAVAVYGPLPECPQELKS